MSVTRTLASSLAVALLAVGIAPSASRAQGFNPVLTVSKSIWTGDEDFTGRRTILSFGFRDDGKVTMVDTSTITNRTPPVMGTWTQNGSEVSIRFNNCLYVGRINGNQMTGQAQWTSGPTQGRIWNFALRLDTIPPGPGPLPAPLPGPAPAPLPGPAPLPPPGFVPPPAPLSAPLPAPTYTPPPVPDFAPVPGGNPGPGR
jgi:hypothetical protein